MNSDTFNVEKYMPWLKFPETISVEIMSLCNLKCKHCYIYNSNGAANRLMEYNRFESICSRLLAVIPKATIFNFASVEALMHPRIFDMIDLVRGINPALRTPIYTNGMLLTTDNVIKLLERGIHEIHVSLDGYTPETVETFKTGVSFQRVKENIVKALAKSYFGLKISTIFVTHRNNIHELPDYVDFCANMGISSINVTGFISYNQSMASDVLYSYQGNPAVEDILLISRERAQRQGINFSCRSTRLKQKDFNCVTCGILYITEDGEVSPCNVLARPTTLCFQGDISITTPVSFGSVFSSTPEELWQLPAYAIFRKLFHNGALPQTCRFCPMARGVIC